MNYSEKLYAGSVVKGPHSWKGNDVYYVTTVSPTETYLRKDGTVGNGTKAMGAPDETIGFWDSKGEAHIALDIWKIQYYNKLHGIKEPEAKPEPIKEVKRYTKKEFLKLIQVYV